ncbi:MAG TPA: class I SAM-dependent methyltransferase [Pirellulaceae bacterium]|nr:class I SAM-dependent methyltransferase [Pirellulaceae bacterium]
MSNFDRQKWNAKYQTEPAPREPSQGLIALDCFLPRSGKAIDLACGAARHGIWLAQRGLDVTIADISAVGLSLAMERAAERGVSIKPLEIDLEHDSFPPGPWDLILSVCYLQRSMFAAYPTALAPGGTLVVIQPTKKNLERHAKPPADFLLDEGELPGLIRSLEVLHYQEAWSADDRHDAVLVARRPVGQAFLPAGQTRVSAPQSGIV